MVSRVLKAMTRGLTGHSSLSELIGQSGKASVSRRSTNKRQAERTATRIIKSLSFLLAGLIILVGGSAVGIGNFGEAHNDRKLLSEGVQTVGFVTAVNFSTGGRGREYKDLTVSFLTTDRSVYAKNFRDRYYANAEGSTSEVTDELTGQRMTVFYDRADPRRSVIEGSGESYTAACLVIITAFAFGASFIGTGVAGLSRKYAGVGPRRREKTSDR